VFTTVAARAATPVDCGSIRLPVQLNCALERDNGLLAYTRKDNVTQTPRIMEWLEGISAPSPFTRSVALLVGVGWYSNSPLSAKPLPSRQDVAEMRDFLLLDEKFDVVYVLLDQDATPSKIDNLMMNGLEATGKVHRGDRFLFYFSGHGADVGSGVGYMLFSDYMGKYDRETALQVNECALWSRKLPAKHVLFLLDGCSSGLGIVSKSSEAVNRRTGDGSRFAYTATRGSEAALARAGSLSVFTAAFLDVVRNGLADKPRAGFMTIHGIADEVETRLAQQLRAGQAYHDKEPVGLPLPDWIHNSGEFVFINPKINKALNIRTAIEGSRSLLFDAKSEAVVAAPPTVGGGPRTGASVPSESPAVSGEARVASVTGKALTIISEQTLPPASVGASDESRRSTRAKEKWIAPQDTAQGD
jgi:Caspase domain